MLPTQPTSQNPRRLYSSTQRILEYWRLHRITLFIVIGLCTVLWRNWPSDAGFKSCRSRIESQPNWSRLTVKVSLQDPNSSWATAHFQHHLLQVRCTFLHHLLHFVLSASCQCFTLIYYLIALKSHRHHVLCVFCLLQPRRLFHYLLLSLLSSICCLTFCCLQSSAVLSLFISPSHLSLSRHSSRFCLCEALSLPAITVLFI